MGRLVNWLRTRLRLLILHSFDIWYRLRRPSLPPITWVIGANEVASMVKQLREVLPGSFTYMKFAHPFYGDDYDYCPKQPETRLAHAWRLWIVEPALFARLARSATGFIYLSDVGYLTIYEDYRAFEFAYLRSRGVKVVCYFTGTDIRSPKLMLEQIQESGNAHLALFLGDVAPNTRSPEFEYSRKRNAEIAEEYANAIFTFPIDQKGYFTRPTLPFQYFIDDNRVLSDLDKFDAPERVVILHAPSNPILKGTALVRAAVEQLAGEGFSFEYVELTDSPHDQVIEQLKRSHIVLNQFYSYVPGVFGIEAMAAGCVVMMSADCEIETALPSGSNTAWVVTKHWQVADNLRDLLQSPGQWRAQALAGQDWLRQHAVSSVSGRRLREILSNLPE